MSVHHIRGRAASRLPIGGLLLAAVLSVVAARSAVAVEATPAASPETPAPSPAAPASSTAPAATFDQVFGDVAPEEIPFRYRCDGPSFTASDLAYGAPPIDPPLASFAGWQFVGQEGPLAGFVSPPVERTSSEEAPFESQTFEQQDSGSWLIINYGDCAPEAVFRRQGAVAGYWELATPGRPPAVDATSFDIKVWDSKGCRAKVRVQGEPRVRVTEHAVLVAVGVHPPRGDSCGPVDATRVTVELPEPLGNRAILDAGRLPMPVVVPPPA